MLKHRMKSPLGIKQILSAALALANGEEVSFEGLTADEAGAIWTHCAHIIRWRQRNNIKLLEPHADRERLSAWSSFSFLSSLPRERDTGTSIIFGLLEEPLTQAILALLFQAMRCQPMLIFVSKI